MIRYDLSNNFFDVRPITTDQRTVFNVPLHCHSYYEAEIILDGSALHLLNGDSYQVERGDLYFCSPDDFHRLIVDENRGITLRSFKFDQNAITPKILEAIRQVRFPIVAHIGEERISELETLFLKLEKELSREAQKCQKQIVMVLAELISLEIIRLCESSPKTVRIDSVKNGNIATIFRGIEYINEHISESFSRDDVAGYVQYTPGYFSHMFSEITGKSFSEYVMERRITLAKSLLVNTDYPILKISELSGFSSQSLFHRKFREITGTTPQSYRKDHNA